MNKEYIYIGQYFHYYGKDLGILDKKIGKTINLDQREMQLNRTNGTIGYAFIAAWEVENMNMIENTLHSLLSATRLYADNRPTEWFDDEDESLVNSVRQFMDNLNIGKEIDLGIDKDAKVNEIRHSARSTKLIITWNDKIYQESSSHKTLGKWAEDFISNPELTEDQLLSTYLFRKEPQLNPSTGLNYTTELSNNWWIMHNISNSRKAKSIENIARDFKLNIKVEHN